MNFFNYFRIPTFCAALIITPFVTAAAQNETTTPDKSALILEPPQLPTFKEPSTEDMPPVAITANEVMEQINVELLSKGVENAVKTIKELHPTPDVARAVVRRVLQSKTFSLSPDDKITFVLGVARLYKDIITEQNAFFVLLPQIIQTQNGAPLFFVAAQGDYADTIPALKQWWTETRNTLKQELERAFHYGVHQNEPSVLKKLEEHGMELAHDLASRLLWEAVTHNAHMPVINYLLEKKADPNYRPKKKQTTTMLMEAIKRKNKDTVQALIKAGADLNAHVLPAKNVEITTLEVADKYFPEIKNDLIKSGARE